MEQTVCAVEPPLAGFTDLPRPLDVEVPRPRLVGLLAKRWNHAVTLVVAGAGFGKTTVLAQVVRTHLVAPRGVDVWVSCTAAHGDPSALTRAVLAAMPCRSGARSVLDALVRLAPVEVCLISDDVHEIPAASPGAALLGELVRSLPATTHLVLSGRSVPDLPLAATRRRGSPGTATPVLTYVDGPAAGEPAVTRNSHGAGFVWYVSTRPTDDGLADIMRRACADSGVDPHDDLPADVEVIRRGPVLFAINHGDQDAKLPAVGTELLTDTPVRRCAASATRRGPGGAAC